MTSPSWPVIVRLPLPGIAVASMNSTSPPTGVHARPVATPGGWCGARLGVEPLPAQQLARTRLGRRVTLRLALPSATWRATLRQTRADLALELAHAGLARVVGDDHAQRRRR